MTGSTAGGGAQLSSRSRKPTNNEPPKSGGADKISYADSLGDELTERTLFELAAFRDSLELGDGDPNFPQVGGIYGEVATVQGFERHHIPSVAVQDDSRNNLPVVLISKEDHALTDSYRWKQKSVYKPFLPSAIESKSHREEAASAIDQGNYFEVVRNEIYNIIDRCGHRYDGAIKQYFAALEAYLRKNGVPSAVHKG